MPNPAKSDELSTKTSPTNANKRPKVEGNTPKTITGSGDSNPKKRKFNLPSFESETDSESSKKPRASSELLEIENIKAIASKIGEELSQMIVNSEDPIWMKKQFSEFSNTCNINELLSMLWCWDAYARGVEDECDTNDKHPILYYIKATELSDATNLRRYFNSEEFKSFFPEERAEQIDYCRDCFNRPWKEIKDKIRTYIQQLKTDNADFLKEFINLLARLDKLEDIADLLGDEYDKSSLLLASARSGATTSIKYLLNNDADINAEHGEASRTPLIWAIENKQADAAKFLLKNDADIHWSNLHLHTALHVAAWNGTSLELIKLLISKGAEINKQAESGYTPLMLAAINKQADAVKILLKNDADIHLQDWENEATALHVAAGVGASRDIIELLISNGADINAKDKDGKTPLMWAIEKNHTDVVELLLDAGGNIEDINVFSLSDEESFKKIIENTRSLNNAVYTLNQVDILKWLNEAKTSINFTNNDGNTLLHRIISADTRRLSHEAKLEIIQKLIARKANPYIRNNEGKFPSELTEDNAILKCLQSKEERYLLKHCFTPLFFEIIDKVIRNLEGRAIISADVTMMVSIIPTSNFSKTKPPFKINVSGNDLIQLLHFLLQRVLDLLDKLYGKQSYINPELIPRLVNLEKRFNNMDLTKREHSKGEHRKFILKERENLVTLIHNLWEAENKIRDANVRTKWAKTALVNEANHITLLEAEAKDLGLKLPSSRITDFFQCKSAIPSKLSWPKSVNNRFFEEYKEDINIKIEGNKFTLSMDVVSSALSEKIISEIFAEFKGYIESAVLPSKLMRVNIEGRRLTFSLSYSETSKALQKLLQKTGFSIDNNTASTYITRAC